MLGRPCYPTNHMEHDDTFGDSLFLGPLGPLIPVEFESTETKSPFLQCSNCSLPFAEMDPSTCFIEKAMRQGECIVEVALCSDCLSSGRCDWSEESIEKLEQHNIENPLSPAGLAQCAGCSDDADIWADDVTYVGIVDPIIGLLGPPALICTECLQSLEGTLSVETRRQMDEFTESLLPGIGSEDIPSSSLFVL